MITGTSCLLANHIHTHPKASDFSILLVEMTFGWLNVMHACLRSKQTLLKGSANCCIRCSWMNSIDEHATQPSHWLLQMRRVQADSFPVSQRFHQHDLMYHLRINYYLYFLFFSMYEWKATLSLCCFFNHLFIDFQQLLHHHSWS